MDLYISGRNFTDGIGDKGLDDIKRVNERLEQELHLVKHTLVWNGKHNEENFGYGADWTVALIQYIAHSDVLKAIATTGGLITFTKHVVTICKKIWTQNVSTIYLGINTAKLFAIHYVANDCKIVENIEILNALEINRGETGFVEKEFLFILGLNKKPLITQKLLNKEKTYNRLVCVHIDWRGNLIDLKKY